jgi:cytidylate kinase
MAVVTLGGLTGGGGRLLGPNVAGRLGADYVDRLILADAARRIGATVEALHQREERPFSRGERFMGLLQRILERSAVAGIGTDPYFGAGALSVLTQEFEEIPLEPITRGHELEDEQYIQAMRDVISQLAVQDNVVIVGRGGSIILRDHPNVLRVGTVARVEDRISMIMERDQAGREQAEKTLLDRDQARADYYLRYFGLDNPDDPELYHLVINTSDLSMDYACDLVVEAYKALEDGRLPRKPGAGA